MSPKEEKKQEAKQREVSDAELQKVAGGGRGLAEVITKKKRTIRLLDAELTGVTGGAGGVIREKAPRKKR